MNQDLKTHFRYNWWKYLVVLLVAVVLWNGLFTALAQPKDHEKLTVACFASEVNTKALQADLEENRASFTGQPLKKLSVETYLDYANDAMYFSYALASADVFIFSEDMVLSDENGNSPVTYKALFQPIPMDTFSELLGDNLSNLRLFGDDSGIYGVYISGAGQNNRFTQMCDQNTACILFFNPDSVNLNRLYGKGNGEHGGAIDLLLYLLQ